MVASRELHPSAIDPALPAMESDVFRGYLADDPERIRAVMPPETLSGPGWFTDAMGVKVSPDYCP